MNDKIIGYVLNESDYREADVLMQVLAKDYGVLSLIGTSAKKLNSKNHCLPQCKYEFIIDYKDNKTIYTIHNRKLLEDHFDDKDIIMMSFRNVLGELVLKNREIELYDSFDFVMERLNEKNMYLLGCLFLSDLLRKSGITPMVDGCVICSNKKVVAISNKHGGFLCLNHLSGEQISDVETLRKFRVLNKADFKDYDKITNLGCSFKDFNLMMSFYLDNSDLKLRSYDFYRALI